MGRNYSSKLSPWLACGALSPRYVYHETKRYEQKHLESESSKHFISELFWRDFCHYYCYKHGNGVFYEFGPLDKGQSEWRVNPKTIQRWKEGTTGMPLIDAFMRELKESGFMGNRGRQIVASYLALDMKQDWRFGGQHFEETLIDHDVHSNYASWNFAAGLGPSKVLMFNVVKQSYDFDRDGEFIRLWVPELADVPTEYIHEPWNMPRELQESLGVIIGKDYPRPIDSRYTGSSGGSDRGGRGGRGGKKY